MNSVIYGQLQSEKVAQENQLIRQIVKEIGDFGVNERQRLLIIYQLAMELEDISLLKDITDLIKERKGSVIFLTGKVDEDG